MRSFTFDLRDTLKTLRRYPAYAATVVFRPQTGVTSNCLLMIDYTVYFR
jgi:hypothetical protein